VRRDEIDLVYASGRDAVAALIAAQAARIDELVAANTLLTARVEELERQAGRNSRNSSLPPSRDLAGRSQVAAEEAFRTPSGRPAGPSGPVTRDARRSRPAC